MITPGQLLAHFVGDYIIQSDWMANSKTKGHVPAAVHALTYALPFLFLRPSLPALAVMIVTHFCIDRWRLARYVVWAKNWLGPFWRKKTVRLNTLEYPDRPELHDCGPKVEVREINQQFVWCAKTGYPAACPGWLSFWLLIIADNILHVTINGLALKYL